MKDKEQHPIRNGIIATVVGGLVLSLFSPMRDLFLKIIKWLVAGIIWIFKAIMSSYLISGYLLIVLGILAITGLISLYFMFRPEKQPEFKGYTEDTIYGAKWRWSWNGNAIYHLWCYCPHCDAELVYNDSACKPFSYQEPRTDFICERCNNQLITQICGGNKSYAVGAVEREIRRKIRTNEYKKI